MLQGGRGRISEWLGIMAGVSLAVAVSIEIYRLVFMYADHPFWFYPNFDTWGLYLLLLASLALVGGSISSMKAKSWGRFLVVLVACFLLLMSLLLFLNLGFLARHHLISMTLVWGVTLLVALYQKVEREAGLPTDRLRRLEKWAFIAFAALGFAVVTSYYITIWKAASVGYSSFRQPDKIVVPFSKGTDASVERKYLNVALNLPPDFTVMNVYHSDSGPAWARAWPWQMDMVQIINKERNAWITIDNSTFFEVGAHEYGYENSLDFGRRLIRERVAIIAHITRVILDPEYDEVEIGDWTGIRNSYQRPVNGYQHWDYSLWHRTSRASMRIGVKVKGSPTPAVVAQGLISTIHYVDYEKNGDLFFKRGKGMIAEGRAEDAKFELVNALYADWGNAESHYWMARAYFDTGRFESAGEHLNHALESRPDYPEAKELKVKAEEARKAKETGRGASP